MRKNNRSNNQLREIKIIPHVLKYAEGSAKIILGNTEVICTASVDMSVPKWINTPNTGWLTAQYGMLPRSTHQRMHREKASKSGRTQEISRLIGRSLRAAIDLKKLGERQIHIDCDVIQADGGTRTAAITGGFVALALALNSLKQDMIIEHIPLTHYVSAISVGLLNNKVILDLCYTEDQKAQTDMNVVFASNKQLVEIQGTAEGKTFSRTQLDEMLDISFEACQKLFIQQQNIIGSFFPQP